MSRRASGRSVVELTTRATARSPVVSRSRASWTSLAAGGSAAAPAMGVGFSSLIVSLGQYNRTKPRRPTAFPRFWREANSAKNLTRAEGTRAPDTLSVEVFGEDLPEEREEPAPVRRGCHPPRLAPHRLGRLRHGHAQTRRADHLEIILLVAHRDDVRERHAEMVGDHAEGRALGGGGRNHLEVVSPGHDEPRLLAHRPRQVVADDGKRLGMADEQGLDEPAHGTPPPTPDPPLPTPPPTPR